ncbi:family 1 glycosylhydrolase [Saccharopolyspora cebuensis]|uniref:Family 1 glycosylhydrolase n=1 Tax=Saccharopolyspora cebuensis TaxID=418759 RepID=A0ABV4CAJ6_9PSEU
MTESVDADAGSAPLRFAVGIEDTFVPHEFPGQRRLDEYELTQHYQFWEHDLELVAESGAGSLRWGVPWYRVEPEPGRFEWDWVDRVVARLAELGVGCIVDLVHYGTPLWLDNAFLHPDYPKRVAEYAVALAERHGDVLREWTPLNEPVVNAERCGQEGAWPPYLRGDTGFAAVLLRLAEGICRTQEALAEVRPGASFVHVDAGLRYTGEHGRREFLEHRRFLGLDLVTGAVRDGHPLAAWLSAATGDDARLAWVRDHAVIPDVVGVNYYPAFSTTGFDEHGGTRPVEAGTAGLAELLRLYWERYRLPVMVTETSRDDTVSARREWLADSVACVRELRAQDVPVVGYTWFPFLDMVAWRYRESTAPLEDFMNRMGLAGLHREPGGGSLLRRATEALDDFRRLSGG